MTQIDRILYRIWYGPLRRPFRALARRLLGRNRRVVFGPLRGLVFNGHETVCRMGLYELPIQQTLTEMLKEGDVLYDIGANNGYLSLLGSRCVGRTGKVFSFEPLPGNARRVEELIADNKIENCTVVQAAVSESVGSTEFYIGGDSDPYTPSLIRARRSQTIEVDLTTLDRFIDDNPPPTFIKMDIEGAEVMAVRGAGKLLSGPNPPRWLIEVHSAETDQGVREILSSNGYRISSLKNSKADKPYPAHIMAWKEA